MELNQLIRIEEKIEMGFIALAKLESNGLQATFEYEDTLKITNDLVGKEKKLLETLSSEEIINLRKQVLKVCNNNGTTIALGHLVNASYQRLLNIFNNLLGSEAFDYATYLRYDINQIIFSFLSYLINNDGYEAIREDLIFYKYNLIFMNYLSENDFLKTRNISTINIESKSFKTDYTPDLIFVDKSILILEGREYVDFIEKFDDGLENSNNYALVLISILELLTRLILSEDDILKHLQEDFSFLLNSDSISHEVKNLVNDMLIILDQLKSSINVAR